MREEGSFSFSLLVTLIADSARRWKQIVDLKFKVT